MIRNDAVSFSLVSDVWPLIIRTSKQKRNHLKDWNTTDGVRIDHQLCCTILKNKSCECLVLGPFVAQLLLVFVLARNTVELDSVRQFTEFQGQNWSSASVEALVVLKRASFSWERSLMELNSGFAKDRKGGPTGDTESHGG